MLNDKSDILEFSPWNRQSCHGLHKRYSAHSLLTVAPEAADFVRRWRHKSGQAAGQTDRQVMVQSKWEVLC